MNTKFVIFVVLSALFVASIYSISSSIVLADTTTCVKLGKFTLCGVVSSDDNGKPSLTEWKCARNPDGKTYHCEEIGKPASPSPELNTALNNAVKGHLGAATGGASSGENNTHLTNGNIVKSDGTLKGDGSTQDTQGTRQGKNSTSTLQ